MNHAKMFLYKKFANWWHFVMKIGNPCWKECQKSIFDINSFKYLSVAVALLLKFGMSTENKIDKRKVQKQLAKNYYHSKFNIVKNCINMFLFFIINVIVCRIVVMRFYKMYNTCYYNSIIYLIWNKEIFKQWNCMFVYYFCSSNI